MRQNRSHVTVWHLTEENTLDIDRPPRGFLAFYRKSGEHWVMRLDRGNHGVGS